MNLAKRLKVDPGSKVTLSDIDPDFHGTHESEDEAKAELQHNLTRITELQRKLLRRSRPLSADCPAGDRWSRQGRYLLARR